MAGFCSLCGAKLGAPAATCPSCGAPVIPAAGGGAAPAPPVRPQKKGLSALAIVLIVLGSLAVIGIGIVSVGAWFISRAVDVDRETGEVSVKMGGAAMTMRQTSEVDEEEIGVPIFPGAWPQAVTDVEMPGGLGTSRMWMFFAPASREEVAAFYRRQLAAHSPTERTLMGTTQFEFRVGPGDGRDRDKFTVSVDRRGGQSAITIIRERRAREE
jgi:hypothetical protein